MMEKRILIVTLAVCSLLLFIGLLPVHGEEEIYDTVVRLHVLANSDSEEDQAVKLQVRDAILTVTSPALQGCKTRDEAKERLESATPEILSAAQNALKEAGKDAPVTIAFDEEPYPERNYDGICFPAGNYLSMRVCIGDAEGQNWWCCLFPPLCLGSSTVSDSDAEDAFISVGLTPSQYKIITETDRPVYKVRFRILELFQGLR